MKRHLRGVQLVLFGSINFSPWSFFLKAKRKRLFFFTTILFILPSYSVQILSYHMLKNCTFVLYIYFLNYYFLAFHPPSPLPLQHLDKRFKVSWKNLSTQKYICKNLNPNFTYVGNYSTRGAHISSPLDSRP